MLRMLLYCGGILDDRVGIVFVRQGENRLHYMGAHGERSGLVEYDRRQLPRQFERCPVADQQAVGRRQRGGDGDDERDRYAQGMRTGRYHDRDHPFQCEGSISTTDEPVHERSHADGDGDEGQPFRHLVREVLRTGLCGLCLAYEIDDPVQITVPSDRRYLDLHCPIAVDGSCDDLPVRLFPYGKAFSGEHTFIDVRTSLHYNAIGWNLFPWSYDDGFIFLQVLERYGHRFTVPFHGHDVRQQGHQRLQCFRCGHLGTHFQPMSQQHDVDERRQLPEKVHAPQTESDGDGIDVGYGYGDGDERHHTCGLRPDLSKHSLQEGHAAIDIDRRSECE